MSSSEVATASVKEEAYQPSETYGEAFPALSTGPAAVTTAAVNGSSNSYNMALKSSTVTQVFSVPVEERRYKLLSEPLSGEQTQQAKACQEVMKAYDVNIETSLARDQSLTIVLTGRSDSVMKAKRAITTRLQTQASTTLNIPKEHHRFLLGKSGKKLADLELQTATKISVPRTDDSSEAVRITGTKEAIDRAAHEIQLISDEQAKLAFERVSVPKLYHPFVCGPNNSAVKKLAEETGARINVPPPSVLKDEITVAGEKDGVARAVSAIKRAYEEKARRCQTVSVEVNKKQHKYVIGQRGANIQEILQLYGVSVEVPPPDSQSQTITLRGEQDKLGHALTVVYAKANSIVTAEVPAPAWLHRFVIGKKGENVRKISQDLPKVHIEFSDGEDRITLEGPPEEVVQAQKVLEATVKDLVLNMAFAEVKVPKKFHRNIIGKNGANRIRISNETGVSFRIPAEDDPNEVIRIEGNPEGVNTAKQELVDMVKKMENEKSKDIIIEQRFHRAIIGAKGEKIKEIRDKFNQVQITLPDPSKKSDIVSLRGPKDDVDKCFKYLERLHKDMIESNQQADVHIFKQFHKNIIGKNGANIKKIRDETNTRIDLPSEDANSDAIRITGKKVDIEKAKALIEQMQKELANIAEVTLDIPHKLHNSIIGTKGRLIKAVMDECGGVLIRFPPENSSSDSVLVRGPKDDVERARKQLLELANDKKESSFTCEIRAKPEYHKFLIGKGGANIRKVRENYGARVIFPGGDKDDPADVITIMGKQENVEKAKLDLERQIKSLEDIVEAEVNVPVKWHRNFIARRGEMLNQIAADFGGVSVSFPRSGSQSERVVLKGAQGCVDGARQRIVDIVAELENMVTIECVIPQKYHRTVMGPRGTYVQEITKERDVQIKFPERPPPKAVEKAKNGQVAAAETAAPADDGQPSGEADIPRGGSGEEDHAAAAAPPPVDASVESDAAADGQTKEAAEEGDGDLGPKDDSPEPEGEAAAAVVTNGVVDRRSVILITGQPANVEAAKADLLALVPITLTMDVPFEFHRYIIGQKGKDVRKMMDDFDVNISVPPPDEQLSTLKVIGVPSNVENARKALEERVATLESEKEDRILRGFQLELRIDSKFHPKIIGRKGAVINKIRADNKDVMVQFPGREDPEQDRILITGYERAAEGAKADIMKIVAELESLTSVEVSLDSRVHPRIIGSKGHQIRTIMSDYGVDIKFPRAGDGDPNLVLITGPEDAVTDCRDHLLNLEEEFMQDINDRAEMERYTQAPSSASQHENGDSRRPVPGYSVRGAPWDMSSNDDFPTMTAAAPAAVAPPPPRPAATTSGWGPKLKR